MAKKRRPFNPDPGPGAEWLFRHLLSNFEDKHGSLPEQARATILDAFLAVFRLASLSTDVELQQGRVRGGKTVGIAKAQAAAERRKQIVAAYRDLGDVGRECDRIGIVAKRFSVHPNTVRNAVKKLL